MTDKISAGALRAALSICKRLEYPDGPATDAIASGFAKTIDSETGLGELIEALKGIEIFLTDCRHDVSEGGRLQRNCLQCDALHNRAAALARVQGKD